MVILDLFERDGNGYNLLHHAANEMLKEDYSDVVLDLIRCFSEE